MVTVNLIRSVAPSTSKRNFSSSPTLRSYYSRLLCVADAYARLHHVDVTTPHSVSYRSLSYSQRAQLRDEERRYVNAMATDVHKMVWGIHHA